MKIEPGPPLGIDRTLTRAHLIACCMQDVAQCVEDFYAHHAVAEATDHTQEVGLQDDWKVSMHPCLAAVCIDSPVCIGFVRQTAAQILRLARHELREEPACS